MTSCVVCGTQMEFVFKATVLRKYDVAYRCCRECGFLQTETPYWLEEAYSEAIAEADTGLVQRNLSIAARLAPLLYYGFDRRGTYVDVAGGHGLLVRLMRDLGFDYFWEDKYCRNVFARGFECRHADIPITAVTAFEVMEHVPDPVEFVAATLKRFDTKTLVFTTEVYEGRPPPADWWYYARNTGQHIGFFQAKTLERMASKLRLRFTILHGLYVFSDQPISHERLVRLLTGPVAAAAALYIRARLGSKTFSDHTLRLGT